MLAARTDLLAHMIVTHAFMELMHVVDVACRISTSFKDRNPCAYRDSRTTSADHSFASGSMDADSLLFG